MGVRSTILASAVALSLGTLIASPPARSAEEPAPQRSVTSTVHVAEENGAVSVRTVNRSFELAGPGLKGRAADEHLLLEKTIETAEVLGDKGMEGRVSVAAWPLDEARDKSPPLYTIAATGSAGAVQDGDLFVIERGLDEIPWQTVYALSDGSRLFDATSLWLRGASGGLWDERRYVALAQVFDDADDAALRGETSVALLTLAARDRILSQVLIKAADPERARFLRSVWDQQVILSWLGGPEAKPLPGGASPDPLVDSLSVLISFKPDGAALKVPLLDTSFDSAKAILPSGLSLEPYPPNLLLGRWTMKDAKPAPWADSGADVAPVVKPFVGKMVSVGEAEVSSDTPLACKNAQYASAMVPPDGLFQGGLSGPNASAQAKSLGLSPEESRSVTLSCDTGVYDFHFVDRDTALLAFDNVIFTLSRAQ